MLLPFCLSFPGRGIFCLPLPFVLVIPQTGDLLFAFAAAFLACHSSTGNLLFARSRNTPYTRYKSAFHCTTASLIAFGVIRSATARRINPANSASLANRKAIICFNVKPCAAVNSSGPSSR